MRKRCVFSGIVKHKDGIGFKVTFDKPETANMYKDMFRFIVKNDGFKIEDKRGYYDNLL